MKVWHLGFPFVLVFGLILISIFGNLGLAVTGQNQKHAQDQLSAYVEGTQYTARSCRNRDTDANGYISCEALDRDDSIVQLECAAPFTLNSGCRVPKLVTNQIQN